MRILAFSDWRTQSIDIMNQIIREEKPDAILYGGDDLRRVIPVKSSHNNTGINTNNIPFYYVNGNDDFIYKNKNNFYLDSSPKQPLAINPSFGIHEIEKGILYYGVECGYGFTNKVYNLPKRYVDILLTHIPPLGHLDLSIRFGLKHIGSKKVLTYIKKYQPKFVICGHSHFWGGKVSKINKTIIINISSNDFKYAPGNYAILNMDNSLYEIKQYKTLRNIRGAIFNTSYENWKVYGSMKLIDDHNLLFNRNEEIIKRLENVNKFHVANRIKSLTWEKPKIVKKLTIQPQCYTFVDIETGLKHLTPKGKTKQKIWLIGLLHNGKIYQFEYPRQKHKLALFLSKNSIKKLVSWTKFDSLRLKKLPLFKKIQWIDACQRVSNCVIWHSYRLHELYNAFFKDKDQELIDGAVAGIYADHIIGKKKTCKYCPPEEKVKKEIKKRNKLDLLQMYELCELLWNYKKQE